MPRRSSPRGESATQSPQSSPSLIQAHHARTARPDHLRRTSERAGARTPTHRHPAEQSVPPPHRCARRGRPCGPRGRRRQPNRQTDRHRTRRRVLRRTAPDDRRPAALVRRGQVGAQAQRPRRVRLRNRQHDPDRGEQEEARVPPLDPRPPGAGSPRPRRTGNLRHRRRYVLRAPARHAAHAQARADRPAHLRRHRQRLQRRNPVPRRPFPVQTGQASDRRRGAHVVRGLPRRPDGMDRPPARRNGRRVSRAR